MFTEPSVLPIDCCIGMSGGVKPLPWADVPVEDAPWVPQAATRARAAAPTSVARGRMRVVMASPGLGGWDAGVDGFFGLGGGGPEREIRESRWNTTTTGRSETSSGGPLAAPLLGRDTVRRGPASSSTMAWVLG